MPREKFDPSKVERAGNVLYRRFNYWDREVKESKTYTRPLTTRELLKYNRWKYDKQSNRPTFSSKYKKFFNAGTKFVSQQGHIQPWAKPLALRGGENPNYNWRRASYRDFDGTIRKDSSRSRWGADINRGKKGVSGSATVLVGTKQWIRQIQISLYQLYVSAENFRVVAGRRAMKVFQNSFKYQQFYSNKSHNWAPLSSYTLKKRAGRGTGSKILKEYGDLYNSIRMDEHAGLYTTRVYTDVVHANASHHKKHSICYAGYHNEGKGTYGSGWNGHKPKPYIRRQFMGHSSHLDPLTDNFMRRLVKLYLFDNVFLVKKV